MYTLSGIIYKCLCVFVCFLCVYKCLCFFFLCLCILTQKQNRGATSGIFGRETKTHYRKSGALAQRSQGMPELKHVELKHVIPLSKLRIAEHWCSAFEKQKSKSLALFVSLSLLLSFSPSLSLSLTHCTKQKKKNKSYTYIYELNVCARVFFYWRQGHALLDPRTLAKHSILNKLEM